MSNIKAKVLTIWNSMSSKKRDASSWGVGVDDSEGQAQVSTINDPVYSQPTSAPPQPQRQPGSRKSYTRPATGSGSAPGRDDPVYSQAPIGGPDGQEGQPTPTSRINDPVYGQPVEAEAKPRQIAPDQGKGQVDAANDPVYSQPQPRPRPQAAKATVNDPVYAQPQPVPSASGSADPGPGQGKISAADDPVYSHSASRSGSAQPTTVADPVYGQQVPSLPSSAPSQRAPSPGQGTIPPADDPVYSQSSGNSPQTKTVADPVYGQQVPPPSVSAPGQRAPPGPEKASIAPADDPVYSQSSGSLLQPNTVADPVYGQQVPPPPTPDQRAPNPGQGSIPAADDPVYSQSMSTPAKDSIPPADDPVYSQSTGSTASSRLSQLTWQISPPQSESVAQPNTKRPRKANKKKNSSDLSSSLPADYSDILNHLSTLRRIAQTPDLTSRGYQRQKTSGKLWSRERIAQLLDPDTWREVGSVTGTVEWERDAHNPQLEHVRAFTPSNNPQGFGRVTDVATGVKRTIYLTSDDFSIRSGHADGSVAIKTLYGEKLALRLKTPVVKLVDGSSGGGSVSTIMTNGYSYMPHVTILRTVVKQLNMGIPNLGAVLGPAIGLGAARVVSTHFSVMAGDIGSLFNAGPKVVEGATFEEGLSFADLGGPNVHCTNGTIDNLAANEEGCFRQIRTVLGYLPRCGQFEAPPCVLPCADPVDREDVGLRSVVPRKKSRSYNPYTIIESVVDRGSWFEIGGLWGRTGITGLARLGGRPVGILSLNCEVNSGALDAMGSQKLMKMLKFCDVFNLPVVQFVDVPGYAIGTVAERTATMKWGVELGKAYYSTTTPIFSVITRRVYGVAGGIMLDSREPWMRVAWPSGNWGSLPLDGGIEVGHRHELKQIGEKEGPEAVKRRYKELEDEYIRLMNPVRTATVFNVEEIVDPKDTRSICCRWVKQMYGLPMKERLADRASGKIHAVFT